MARRLLCTAAMTDTTNTWILGLDLGDRSRGAALIADWLAGPEHTLAVHVLELWTRPYIRTDVVESTRAVIHRVASELHIEPPAHMKVIDAETAEQGLTIAGEGAAGLVLGRAAGSDEHLPWGLGHVARRVLRSLPCPVVVVPRDLTAVAPGPVLLATDLDTASTAAVAFAREVAGRHGRELVVVHVVEDRYSDLVQDPFWQQAQEAYRSEREQRAHTWMTEHALIGRPHVAFGGVVDRLQARATDTRAAMVVVGSRRLGTLGRIFLGSTASALAARAPCPVAVVPAP